MPRALVTLCLLLCLGASTKPATRPAMDYGPFLSYSVTARWEGDKTKGSDLALKGISIKLDDQHTICFDTDLMRWAGAWKDGFLDLSQTHQILLKGTRPPSADGQLLFTTPMTPGVSPTTDLADPRPDHMGPLPRDFAHYNGLYINGSKTILSYTVGDAQVLEMPTPTEIQFNVTPNRSLSFQTLPIKRSRHPDLANLTHGGPARYQPLTTHGIVGDNQSAYTLDTLTIPENNPWHSWIRPTGLDFFSDGRAAICTLNGDVWIISDIDEKLENLTWKRFATGLYEPLGLVIVKDQIYVRGRDQITRLHDLNNDGEADFYENFNNDGAIDSGYHAFCYDLQADSLGNLYYARGGHWYKPGRRDTNAVFRVSPDGLKTEIVATGFRAPNGIALGPGDTLFTSDNQGNWTPTSKINLVRPGAFHGFVADPQFAKNAVAPKSFEPPICWIPYDQDNSSGGQCFVSDPRFGPLSNHLFHTSYGKSSLFLVLHEQVGENKIPQGGVVPLNFKFDSGILRARVNPKDGQLYVCGIKGWQTSGNRDGCLQRIRYTSKAPHLPIALHVKENSLEITFSDPLDRASATDKDSYSIEQWNYRWTSEYGSKEYSPSQPGKVGHDPLEITTAVLSADGRTVKLTVENLAPVMQSKIAMKIKAADGAEISTAIYNTINAIPTKPH
jgi:glucose/arabinose dehydrogenase